MQASKRQLPKATNLPFTITSTSECQPAVNIMEMPANGPPASATTWIGFGTRTTCQQTRISYARGCELRASPRLSSTLASSRTACSMSAASDPSERSGSTASRMSSACCSWWPFRVTTNVLSRTRTGFVSRSLERRWYSRRVADLC